MNSNKDSTQVLYGETTPFKPRLTSYKWSDTVGKVPLKSKSTKAIPAVRVLWRTPVLLVLWAVGIYLATSPAKTRPALMIKTASWANMKNDWTTAKTYIKLRPAVVDLKVYKSAIRSVHLEVVRNVIGKETAKASVPKIVNAHHQGKTTEQRGKVVFYILIPRVDDHRQKSLSKFELW